MSTYTAFLSCYSAEFCNYRVMLCRDIERFSRADVNLQIQEKLHFRSDATLAELDKAIGRSECVIQIIGSSLGASVRPEYVNSFLRGLSSSELLSLRNILNVESTEIVNEIAGLGFSYTEWEAVIARLRLKKVLVFYSNNNSTYSDAGFCKSYVELALQEFGYTPDEPSSAQLGKANRDTYIQFLKNQLQLLSGQDYQFRQSIRDNVFKGYDHLKELLLQRLTHEKHHWAHDINERTEQLLNCTRGLPLTKKLDPFLNACEFFWSVDHNPVESEPSPSLQNLIPNLKDEAIGAFALLLAEQIRSDCPDIAKNLEDFIGEHFSAFHRSETLRNAGLVTVSESVERPVVDVQYITDPRDSNKVLPKCYLRWGSNKNRRVVWEPANSINISEMLEVMLVEGGKWIDAVKPERIEVFVDSNKHTGHRFEYSSNKIRQPYPVVLRLEGGIIDAQACSVWKEENVACAHQHLTLNGRTIEQYLEESCNRGAFFAFSCATQYLDVQQLALLVPIGLWFEEETSYTNTRDLLGEDWPILELPRRVHDRRPRLFPASESTPFKVVSVWFNHPDLPRPQRPHTYPHIQFD